MKRRIARSLRLFIGNPSRNHDVAFVHDISRNNDIVICGQGVSLSGDRYKAGQGQDCCKCLHFFGAPFGVAFTIFPSFTESHS